MSTLIYLVVLVCVFQVSEQRSTPSDTSYVAAVVEYPGLGKATSVNLENYLQFIEEAAKRNVDIIVFPELTLSREPIEVPFKGLLTEHPVPADQPALFNDVLVAISNASKEHEIYVVINTEELVNCTTETPQGENCPEQVEYLFNTNVVFDRKGAVIDRYRKINLFGEPTRKPALTKDLGIFTTDFGVRFGHYICFDILFQIPAFQIIETTNITDIVYPTMWFADMPYLTAIQIQEAYAFGQNINFLAAGANNIGSGTGGSGIYSGKAGALVSIMPGNITSQLLVARVPKVPGEIEGIQVDGPSPSPHDELDALRITSDHSLSAHVTRPLEPGLQEFTLVDREVSCEFKVNLTENQPAEGVTRYRYRASAFSGVRAYPGIGTGGMRSCSIFACTGFSIETCGTRFPEYNPNTTGIFNELSIVATVPTPTLQPEPETNDSGYFPVSLTPSILPLKTSHFSYNQSVTGNLTVISMELTNTDAELYTFAVWGRYFPTDNDTADPPRTDHPTFADEETGETDAAIAHKMSGLLFAVAVLLASVNL